MNIDLLISLMDNIANSSTKDETLQILKNVRDKYENYHKVKYSDEILQYLYSFSRFWANMDNNSEMRLTETDP